MNRRDLLAECAQPGTPVDVLQNLWCVRCGNPECARSRFGKSKFEARIQDWDRKLFLDPPKMAPDDPRYAQIVAQKFITVDGRTPEIRSDWVDPRDLKEPEPAPAIILPTPPAIVVPQAPAPTPPKPTVSPRSTPGQVPAIVGANAQDQSGKILRGAPSGPTTKDDPWAGPQPPDPADVVVQPGAKIRMGGGSGV